MCCRGVTFNKQSQYAMKYNNATIKYSFGLLFE